MGHMGHGSWVMGKVKGYCWDYSFKYF